MKKARTRQANVWQVLIAIDQEVEGEDCSGNETSMDQPGAKRLCNCDSSQHQKQENAAGCGTESTTACYVSTPTIINSDNQQPSTGWAVVCGPQVTTGEGLVGSPTAPSPSPCPSPEDT